MTQTTLLFVTLMAASGALALTAGAEAAPFPGTETEWQGYARYDFALDERPCWVVCIHATCHHGMQGWIR